MLRWRGGTWLSKKLLWHGGAAREDDIRRVSRSDRKGRRDALSDESDGLGRRSPALVRAATIAFGRRLTPPAVFGRTSGPVPGQHVDG